MLSLGETLTQILKIISPDNVIVESRYQKLFLSSATPSVDYDSYRKNIVDYLKYLAVYKNDFSNLKGQLIDFLQKLKSLDIDNDDTSLPDVK